MWRIRSKSFDEGAGLKEYCAEIYAEVVPEKSALAASRSSRAYEPRRRPSLILARLVCVRESTKRRGEFLSTQLWFIVLLPRSMVLEFRQSFA